jgi:hypothetical protein
MTTEDLTAEVLELKKGLTDLQRRVFPPPVVYLLWHTRDINAEVNWKVLGVFSNMEQAEEAKKAAQDRPGFRDFPLGFLIENYTVGKRHWSEGFVTG